MNDSISVSDVSIASLIRDVDADLKTEALLLEKCFYSIQQRPEVVAQAVDLIVSKKDLKTVLSLYAVNCPSYEKDRCSKYSKIAIKIGNPCPVSWMVYAPYVLGGAAALLLIGGGAYWYMRK
jgi:hypothetical protein